MSNITCNTCAIFKGLYNRETVGRADNQGISIDIWVRCGMSVYAKGVEIVRYSMDHELIKFCPECGASIKRRLRQWKQEAKDAKQNSQ